MTISHRSSFFRAFLSVFSASVFSASVFTACGGEPGEGETTISEGGETSVEVIQDEVAPMEAVAAMSPTEGNTVQGSVTFIQEGEQVRVQVALSGFAPSTRHGFHIHEVGDCSAPDGTSAGGHFNPEGHDHALPEGSGPRHAGDLGNLDADAEGNATLDALFDGITLLPGDHSIGGRSVIVHANADDGGQPTGNAGARISCGVIGTP